MVENIKRKILIDATSGSEWIGGLPFISIILLIGTVAFEPVSRIWLHKDLVYTKGLIPCMAFYYFLSIWGPIYSNVLNGIGKVNLQLIFGGVSAIRNIPLSIFLGRNCGMGSTGVCLATVICMLGTNLPITVSTHRMFASLEASDK